VKVSSLKVYLLFQL